MLTLQGLEFAWSADASSSVLLALGCVALDAGASGVIFGGRCSMKFLFVVALAAAVLAGPVFAQNPPKAPAAAMNEGAKKDITRHRAIAAAHEAAAKCLEAGKTEDVCHKELLAACKGLAIGKYCGMKHQH